MLFISNLHPARSWIRVLLTVRLLRLWFIHNLDYRIRILKKIFVKFIQFWTKNFRNNSKQVGVWAAKKEHCREKRALSRKKSTVSKKEHCLEKRALYRKKSTVSKKDQCL